MCLACICCTYMIYCYFLINMCIRIICCLFMFRLDITYVILSSRGKGMNVKWRSCNFMKPSVNLDTCSFMWEKSLFLGVLDHYGHPHHALTHSRRKPLLHYRPLKFVQILEPYPVFSNHQLKQVILLGGTMHLFLPKIVLYFPVRRSTYFQT
jgi:hypothetical protein